MHPMLGRSLTRTGQNFETRVKKNREFVLTLNGALELQRFRTFLSCFA